MIDPVAIYGVHGDNPPKADLYYGHDVRVILKQIPDKSVHTVCTSPPYWGLRDYGVDPLIWGGDPRCDHHWGDEVPQDSRHCYTGDNSTMEGGVADANGYPSTRGSYCQKCGAWLGQLGLEPTPELFVSHLVEIFREVRRVLRDDGTLWINLGDSYASGNKQIVDEAPINKPDGAENMRVSSVNVAALKSKDLVGIPWMVAFALRADGWYLRSDIIWAKGSCKPESVRDRPTKSHEYVFLLTKQERYYYDLDAIREHGSDTSHGGTPVEGSGPKIQSHREDGGILGIRAGQTGRNKRSVWQVNPKPYPGAHFAVWPEALVDPMIKAGSSEMGCCSNCGAPIQRVSDRDTYRDLAGTRDMAKTPLNVIRAGWRQGGPQVVTVDWVPTCSCGMPATRCTVLDPFSGSSTTGSMALKLGRNYIGIDLNAQYLDLAMARLELRAAPCDTEDESNLILSMFAEEAP